MNQYQNFLKFNTNKEQIIKDHIRKTQISKNKIRLCALLFWYKKKRQNLDRKLEEELQKIILESEQKDEQEIYKKSREIIKGAPVLKLYNEKQNYYEEYQSQDDDQIDWDNQDKDLKSAEPIVNYWKTAIENCYFISHRLDNQDKNKLRYLLDIRYARQDLKNPNNFTLTFIFSENNDFLRNNPIIQIAFIMFDSCNLLQTEINADFQKSSANDSFFQYFQPKNLQEVLDRDPSDSTRQEMQRKIGEIYEIGRIFVDEIIPYSLQYYLDTRQPMDELRADRIQDINQQQDMEIKKQLKLTEIGNQSVKPDCNQQ